MATKSEEIVGIPYVWMKSVVGDDSQVIEVLTRNKANCSAASYNFGNSSSATYETISCAWTFVMDEKDAFVGKLYFLCMASRR